MQIEFTILPDEAEIKKRNKEQFIHQLKQIANDTSTSYKSPKGWLENMAKDDFAGTRTHPWLKFDEELAKLDNKRIYYETLAHDVECDIQRLARQRLEVADPNAIRSSLKK